jgi:hypothetical protein
MVESLEKTNINTLIETIADLRAQNTALKKRIQFLETILAQRVVLTEKSFQERKEHFNAMQELALKIFRQSPGHGFSYNELQEEWKRQYPHLASSSVNVGRRVRELVQARKVWQNLGDDGLARFYLRLEEEKLER